MRSHLAAWNCGFQNWNLESELLSFRATSTGLFDNGRGVCFLIFVSSPGHIACKGKSTLSLKCNIYIWIQGKYTMTFVTNALHSISDFFLSCSWSRHSNFTYLHFWISFSFIFPYTTLIKKAFQCRFMNASYHYDCSHTEKFKYIYIYIHCYTTMKLRCSRHFYSWASCHHLWASQKDSFALLNVK